jgi:FKBP-type peptidyl-prolyl cis-trans isomerase SlyD
MKIHKGCLVELDYVLYDSDGQVVETSEEEEKLSYLHGHGEIPEALERSLEGAEEGDRIKVTLEAGEAYGPYNPDGLVTVPRSQFPADAEIVPGDWIDVQLVEEGAEGPGEELGMRVIEISPEAIVLDANHPLAGQEVTFDLSVVSVRTATIEEIASREQDEDDED